MPLCHFLKNSLKTSIYPRFFVLLRCLLLFYCLFSVTHADAQITPDHRLRDPFTTLNDTNALLRPAPVFDRGRFWTATTTGTLLYGAITYGLYQTWYRDFERGPFRTFNDWPEWLQMDKVGHAFGGYQYARFVQAGAEWTGMDRRHAAWTSFGVSMLWQGTLEMLDAYSVRWGFSWSDMGANTVGAGLHLGQELLWREQRMLLKVSSSLARPPDVPVTNPNGAVSNLSYPSRLRFGTGLVERFLKDYNEQTLWLSVNPRSFLPNSKLPPWLNIALGYGADNVYGAYGNSWRENGQSFIFPETRYRQWYLSPDIYFSRIPTKKRWVRLLLGSLDFFKLPAPALEYGRGRLRLHWLHW